MRADSAFIWQLSASLCVCHTNLTCYAGANVVERDPWGRRRHHNLGRHRPKSENGPVFFQKMGHESGNGVTAQPYIDQFLQPQVVPSFQRHPNFFCQQNNARHIARVKQQFLGQINVNLLPDTARSHDLNPIEHIWNAFQRQLNQLAATTSTDSWSIGFSNRPRECAGPRSTNNRSRKLYGSKTHSAYCCQQGSHTVLVLCPRSRSRSQK